MYNKTYRLLKGAAPALIVEFNDTSNMLADASSDDEVVVKPKGQSKEISFYPWGQRNSMPQDLIDNAFKNNVLSSNLDFNARICYGDGIEVVRKERDENGKIRRVPLLPEEEPKVFEFIEDNNINMMLQELIHDCTLLYNGFVEIIMDKRGTKVSQIRHKEAAHSRISIIDEKTGKSEYHGYSSEWSIEDSPEDVIVTPLLDFANPLLDWKIRNGKFPGPDGRRSTSGKSSSYAIQLAMPSPGKFYYQKALWWSIFESHWFDLSCAIPEFKKNLMKNQMVLKYHIKINKTFFPDLFKAENITDPSEMKVRREEFYKILEDFLASKENAGKNLVTEFQYDAVNKGLERQDLIISPIENFIKGGEYIEDSEEASNAICYAMGVHPSLQGASPGKGKTINGTEARELFIIKQSMMKPFRDMILQPLKIVQSINGWPSNIEFVIPNIMLTTLDKNTGAEKQIGNEKF